MSQTEGPYGCPHATTTRARALQELGGGRTARRANASAGGPGQISHEVTRPVGRSPNGFQAIRRDGQGNLEHMLQARRMCMCVCVCVRACARVVAGAVSYFVCDVDCTGWKLEVGSWNLEVGSAKLDVSQ